MGDTRGTQNGTRARRSKSTRLPPTPTPREEACHKGNLVPSLSSWFPGTRLPPSEWAQRGSPTPKTGSGVPQPRHPRGPLLPPASLILSHASPSDFVPKEVTEMSKGTRKKKNSGHCKTLYNTEVLFSVAANSFIRQTSLSLSLVPGSKLGVGREG